VPPSLFAGPKRWGGPRGVGVGGARRLAGGVVLRSILAGSGGRFSPPAEGAGAVVRPTDHITPEEGHRVDLIPTGTAVSTSTRTRRVGSAVPARLDRGHDRRSGARP